MKKIQELLKEAEGFRSRRSGLAKKLKELDERHEAELQKLESGHVSRVSRLEEERRTSLNAIQNKAREDITYYTKVRQSLQTYVDKVSQWCPESAAAHYCPQPERVKEEEVLRLLEMLEEQGFLAWIKRTFKLDGYASRKEMALELSQKLWDACAYCDDKINQITSTAERERSEEITRIRRETDAENQDLIQKKKDLELRQKEERAQALTALTRFDTSAELQNMHRKLEQRKQTAESVCGEWGSYSVPQSMPEEVILCDSAVTLPNQNGVETDVSVPLGISLYESSIIVVTADALSLSSADSGEKELVRKFLARMLKTVPPEYCSYSIFDSLHKGASLERLVDVKNIGTTDLHFDLFTSSEGGDAGVSCAERRKYLRARPAEIIKFIAGRYRSLFEYNQETGGFEFPFTWYIDFNFPDKPDNRMLEDIKELFVNAPAAGYSFLFVTSPNGYETIKRLAEQYTRTKVLHVDIGRKLCEQGKTQLAYRGSGTPSPDQIYNFMTALKKYYEEGDTIDNRIDSVFAAKGLELRDATKKVSIPMALDSRGRLVDLQLGGEGSVHGFISGGTNSGKSTLLHTIILSACLHYHPRDLELWLVDYKLTEFSLYRKKTPPHIKLIGVSKTPDFTYSLLDHIESEASRRTTLMNRFEAQNLAEYRTHQGEPGYVNIPRLLIVIDEFHEMSQLVAGQQVYKDKLENVLREYRAQGIICLLADQTFSTGLSGLTEAAKNQIGLRIAMRNESSPQEIKNTLEVDRAMYSDSMQRTIALMSQGEFIMKVYIRNARGELTDIKLEKFKGLYSKGSDIGPISKALRIQYRGQYEKGLMYVNTKEQVPWDDADMRALDQLEPLRYPNIRLYLGRAATLRPCFGLDLGRQPDENMAVVGGTALQRWELLRSVMMSCQYRNYKLLVFMAEYSDLICDFGGEIRQLCHQIPGAELMETTAEWCAKLSELDELMDTRQNTEDVVCLFIGLEIADVEFSRLPDKGAEKAGAGSSMVDRLSKYMVQPAQAAEPAEPVQNNREFNAAPMIGRLFASGSRCGIRCVTEVSVYRQFSRILKIREMCRHKIAFSMSAEDCLMYLGNSACQRHIGDNAVYSDGGKDVKKLLTYKIL